MCAAGAVAVWNKGECRGWAERGPCMSRDPFRGKLYSERLHLGASPGVIDLLGVNLKTKARKGHAAQTETRKEE